MNHVRNFAELQLDEQQLVEAALRASANAYAPYSCFAVGAAVRVSTRDGTKKIITGANLENAAYGLGICAEVSALAAAYAQGEFEIDAIAVVGNKFASQAAEVSEIVKPCGRCRQLITEASQISDLTIKVYSCNGDLSKIVGESISKLLPDPFGPKNLGLHKVWPDQRKALSSLVSTRLSKLKRSSPAVYGGWHGSSTR